MSRPKIPDVSWRTCRIAAALLLITLLMATFLVKPAEAETGKTDTPTSHTTHHTPPAPLHLVLARHPFQVTGSNNHQTTPRTTPPKRTTPNRKAPTKPSVTDPKRKTATSRTAQRASRSTPAHRATPALAPTVAGAKSFARSRMSTTEYNCLDNLIRRESGWNHRATNSTSGAYGLMQALPGSKMSSAGPDWHSNPLTQIKWGLEYIKSRYGTPCGAWNFWTKNHWY